MEYKLLAFVAFKIPTFLNLTLLEFKIGPIRTLVDGANKITI